jgi:hypothetical protein
MFPLPDYSENSCSVVKFLWGNGDLPHKDVNDYTSIYKARIMRGESHNSHHASNPHCPVDRGSWPQIPQPPATVASLNMPETADPPSGGSAV